MAKDKKVVLVSEELGKAEFELSHAQRLIAMEHKLGVQLWTPLKGSNYEIIDGSLIATKDSGTDQGA